MQDEPELNALIRIGHETFDRKTNWDSLSDEELDILQKIGKESIRLETSHRANDIFGSSLADLNEDDKSAAMDYAYKVVMEDIRLDLNKI